MNHPDLQSLIHKIEKIVDRGNLLDKSGSIVYSSVDTIRKGDLYTLGANPGGKVDEKIRDRLKQLPIRKRNAYLDENWSSDKKTYDNGYHPLQKRLVHLVSELGYRSRYIFSSNLIFLRSKNQSNLDFTKYAEICWQVHQEFIQIIDPRCFIVFGNAEGNSPFQFIRDKYATTQIEKVCSGHSDWCCKACRCNIQNKERILIGLPHLSIYDITKHEQVIRWINNKLD